MVPIVDRIQELADLDTVDPRVERPLNIEDVRDALEFLDRVMGKDTACHGSGGSAAEALSWPGDTPTWKSRLYLIGCGESASYRPVGENEWDAPADKGDSLFASVGERLSKSYIEHAAEAVACT